VKVEETAPRIATYCDFTASFATHSSRDMAFARNVDCWEMSTKRQHIDNEGFGSSEATAIGKFRLSD
jgi:hypothetical protein